MNNAIVRKLLLFSTYYFCGRKGLDFLDVIIKQSVLWFISQRFKESTVMGFALLENGIRQYRQVPA